MAATRSRKRGKRSAAAKSVKSGVPPSDNSRDVMLGGIGLTEVRQLIRLVQRTGIGELEVSSGGRTVRISAYAGVPLGVAAPPVTTSAPQPASGRAGQNDALPPAAPAAEHHVAITSPMVGTFYRAPAPDADPYVEVGDMVEVGQTVCIIEAMKLMNEIESEVRGRVVKLLVDNAQPVEFGQRLFLVEPV